MLTQTPIITPALPIKQTPTSQPSIPIPTSADHDEAAQETWQTLSGIIIPEADSIDLAQRLAGKQNVPEVFIDTNAPYSLGAKKSLLDYQFRHY